ncbi:MAG TPA: TlpA disulfide reductase family protein [Gammaproteobacteria bacterium]|nr:TlpA disulfide reductase family protein [Gammaproteobacteria bacterium]
MIRRPIMMTIMALILLSFTVTMLISIHASKRTGSLQLQRSISLPTYDLPTIDGKLSLNLNHKYKGKKWVLHIMASWCPYCVDEISVLYHFRDSVRIPVVLLAYKENDFQKLHRLIKKYPGVFTDIMRDDDGLFAIDLGSSGVPTTLVINSEGKVEKVWNQRFTDDNIQELIEYAHANN